MGGGVGQELPDRPDSATVQRIAVVTAEPVQLTGNLDWWSGQGTPGQTTTTWSPLGYSAQRPRRVRAEQVGVPSGISPVERTTLRW